MLLYADTRAPVHLKMVFDWSKPTLTSLYTHLQLLNFGRVARAPRLCTWVIPALWGRRWPRYQEHPAGQWQSQKEIQNVS